MYVGSYIFYQHKPFLAAVKDIVGRYIVYKPVISNHYLKTSIKPVDLTLGPILNQKF